MRSKETITTNNPIASPATGQIIYNYNQVNQLLSATNPSQVFSYDADGNMIRGYTADGYIFTAAYDAANRLYSLRYTAGGVVHKTRYYYSGDSFLAQMKVYENANLVSDIRYVRAEYLPVQERNGSNSITREYAWGMNLGGGIGGLLNLKLGGQDYAYLYDGKGNVNSLLDSTQTLAATYTYDPFGNLLAQTGPLNQPFKFSTKPYDEKTGLSYYGYRFYSPATGRWVNRDPLEEEGGINLYEFVGGNPVNRIDPYGDRWPDFISGSVSITIPTPWTGQILSWSFSVSIDRYGNWYWSPIGPGAGRAPFFVSGSLTANWLFQKCTPSSDQLSNFLSGNGITAAGGYWGGGNIVYSPGNGFAGGLGFVSPQIGGNYSYSFKGTGNTNYAW